MHKLQGNAKPAGRAIPWVILTKFCVIEGFVVGFLKPKFNIVGIEIVLA